MRFPLLLVGFTCCLAASTSALEGWRRSGTGNWRVSSRLGYDHQTNTFERHPVFTFPIRTVGKPGTSLRLTRTVTLPATGLARLVFQYRDSYSMDANHGYHFALLLADGNEVWREDIAAPEPAGMVTVPLAGLADDATTVTITIEARTDDLVTNYGIEFSLRHLTLVQGEASLHLLEVVEPGPYAPLPSEPALACPPVRGLDWTHQAITIQGWAQSQYNLVTDAERWAPFLSGKLGADTLCLLPPDVFNKMAERKAPPGHVTIPPEKYHLPEAVFEQALAAYRRTGFRIVLYTSVIHIGHAREWETGELARKHPEWIQRDRDGNPIIIFGGKWLCPNTGALDYAIAYSKGLVEAHQPDALMFDNSFFQYSTPRNSARRPTCYCDGCRDRFRAYLAQRFGDRCRALLGTAPEDAAIPTEPGLLRRVWKQWRARSWAEAMARIRREIPVVVFGNTEFMWRDWVLGTDRIVLNEDVVFSESVTTRGIAAKMTVARGFSDTAPVFNFLATYVNAGEQYWLQRPLHESGTMIGATLAGGARPWLMFHGWDKAMGHPEPVGEANRPAHQMIEQMFRFCRDHPDYLEKTAPAATVGIIHPSRTRMHHGGGPVPASLPRLLEGGLPVRSIYDLRLATADLSPLSIIVADQVTCLSDAEAKRLGEWVRAGGRLIATPGLGAFDEVGRPRLRSALAALRDQPKLTGGAWEKGRIELASHADALVETLLGETHLLFRADGLADDGAIQVVPWRDGNGRVILHVVNHGPWMEEGEGWTLALPKSLPEAGAATLDSPWHEKPVRLTVRGRTIRMPPVRSYAVVVLEQ